MLKVHRWKGTHGCGRDRARAACRRHRPASAAANERRRRRCAERATYRDKSRRARAPCSGSPRAEPEKNREPAIRMARPTRVGTLRLGSTRSYTCNMKSGPSQHQHVDQRTERHDGAKRAAALRQCLGKLRLIARGRTRRHHSSPCSIVGYRIPCNPSSPPAPLPRPPTAHQGASARLFKRLSCHPQKDHQDKALSVSCR